MEEKKSASPAMSKAHSPKPPFDDMTFTTTPNMLTLVRIAFVPAIVALLFLQSPLGDLLAAIAFTLAAVTDFFDGYLARRSSEITVYGKLMDPLADKFLVVSCLVMLEHFGRIHPVVVILLIGREMAITGLRALASAEGVVISASESAKWKTATQMVAIPFIMIQKGFWGIPVYPIGMALLYISLAISLWSGQDYIFAFLRAAREKRRKKAETKKLLKEMKLAAKKARRAALQAKRLESRSKGRGSF